MDAVKEAVSLGIAENDAYNFEASESGVKLMYNVVSEAVSEKRVLKKRAYGN